MQPHGNHERPTLLDTVLDDDIYDLSAVPPACPLPALALTKTPDDLIERRWGSWVGAPGLDSGAFVERLARGVLEGGQDGERRARLPHGAAAAGASLPPTFTHPTARFMYPGRLMTPGTSYASDPPA